MKIAELIPTGLNQSEPGQPLHDTLYTTYDASNKVIKQESGQYSPVRIIKHLQLNQYDESGRLLEISEEIIDYPKETFPHTYTDSFRNVRTFLYSSSVPVAETRKTISEIAFGTDYYLFHPGNLINVFIRNPIMPLSPPTGYLTMQLPEEAYTSFRPTEFWYYSSTQVPHNDPPLYFKYTDDSKGNLVKLEVQESGKISCMYEFEY